MSYGENFEQFIDKLDLASVAGVFSSRADKTLEEAQTMLNVYVNEARATLHFIEPWLDKSKTILEVGAGLCIFSLFLKSEGFNIYALEPAEGGFEAFEEAKNRLVDSMPDLGLPVIELSIQNLSSNSPTQFDLVFSNNVIEHIPDLECALDSMVDILSPAGVIVHSCPNYLIPYDPHLGIPVTPIWPGLSELIYAGKVAAQRPVWQSLNFVTSFRIKRYARRNKLNMRFVGGELHKAFLRLDEDPIFRERQSEFVKGLHRILRSLRLIKAMAYIPGSISTPMVFEMSGEIDRR